MISLYHITATILVCYAFTRIAHRGAGTIPAGRRKPFDMKHGEERDALFDCRSHPPTLDKQRHARHIP